MDLQKKKRGENWSTEDKDILCQLIAQSAHIIEDKSTKTNINLQKNKEWQNIMIKLNEITGKTRSVAEIKLAWKRMKLLAKANISTYKQQQRQKGGREQLLPPSQEDQKIVAIAPHDLVIEINDYGSNAVLVHHTQNDDAVAGPSCESILPKVSLENLESHNISTQHTVEQVISNTPNVNEAQTTTKETREMKENITKELIIESNVNFKKRHLKMLETEHMYNIEIAKLKIKKLELEIENLKSKNNTKNE